MSAAFDERATASTDEEQIEAESLLLEAIRLNDKQRIRLSKAMHSMKALAKKRAAEREVRGVA